MSTQFLVNIIKYPNLSLANAGVYAPTTDLPVGTKIISIANKAWPNQCPGYEAVQIDKLKALDKAGTPVFLIFQGGEFDHAAFELLSSDEPLTEGNPVVVKASQYDRYERRIASMMSQYRAYIKKTYLKFKCVIGVLIQLKGRGPGIRNDIDVLNVVQREKTRKDIQRLKKSTKAVKLSDKLQKKIDKLTSEKYLESLTTKLMTPGLKSMREKFVKQALQALDPTLPKPSAKEAKAIRLEAIELADEEAKKIALDKAHAQMRAEIKEIKAELGDQMDAVFPAELREEIDFPCDDFEKLIGFVNHARVRVLPLGAGLFLNGCTLFHSIDYGRMIPGQAALYERRQRGVDVVINAGGSFANHYYTMLNPASPLGYVQCEAIEIGAVFSRKDLEVRDYKNIAPAIYVGEVRRGGTIHGQAYLIETGNDGIKHMTIGTKVYEEPTPTGGQNFKSISLALG